MSTRIAAVVLSLALAPAASFAAPPETPSSGRDDVQAQPLLLLMTETDELGDAVARAIATELNDVDVRLEPISMTPEVELRDRIEAGERIVREREAIGLVWIEARSDGLVVHLVVADAGMLRRPITGLDDRSSAIETAAVIVRHFVLDLLAGRPIGLTRFPNEPKLDEPEPEPSEPVAEIADVDTPEPGPPPTPLLDDRGHFRLQAGYVGQTWIRERAWENGVEVNAGWRFANGLHVGAGVGFSPVFQVEFVHPATLGVAQLRVRRYPIALAAGYQHVWQRSRLALDASLRVIAEVVERGVFDPNRVTPQLDRPIVVVPALEPRLTLDYLVIPQLALFAAVGLRTSLVRVDYRVTFADQDGTVIGEQQPLTPRVVAPVVLAGLDMYF